MARTENGGTVYFKLDGAAYDLNGSVKVNLGGAVRTPIVNTEGRLVGYTTKYEHSSIEVELIDSKGLSLRQLRDVSGTLTTLLGSGKSYILADCFTTDAISLDASEAKIGWKLAGDLTEITA
jgi:hypothetical protein